MRARSVRFPESILAVTLALVACGGGKPAAGPTPPKGAADAGTPASSAAPVVAKPPAELGPLPPMAALPAPGVTGSKKGKAKPDAALAGCAGAMPRAKDPEALVRKVGEACATAAPGAKLKATGSPMRGQQADSAPHAEHKLKVQAGKCYRVYFATDEGARDVVVVARDSAGDVVAESPGPALPEGGTMCFTASDEVSLLVSIGAGKASYVVQAWSD